MENPAGTVLATPLTGMSVFLEPWASVIYLKTWAFIYL